MAGRRHGYRGNKTLLQLGDMPDVWRLYDIYAHPLDRDRGRGPTERGYLDEIVQRLPPCASVFDVGCVEDSASCASGARPADCGGHTVWLPQLSA